jgi:hypothetical protein
MSEFCKLTIHSRTGSKKDLPPLALVCNISLSANIKSPTYMIKSLRKLALITLLATAVGGLPLQAVPPPDPKPDAPAAPEAKAKPLPFRGKIGAVDKKAMTITLDERTKRVFQITSETKFAKDGKLATFDAAAVGDYITGSYTKGEDGKLMTKSIKFGVTPPPAKGDTSSGPAAPAAPGSKNQ